MSGKFSELEVYGEVRPAAGNTVGYPVRGACREVVTVTDATVTLTGAQSGAVVALNRAAGVAVTLPATADVPLGANYLVVLVTAISGDCTVTCASGDSVIGALTTATAHTTAADIAASGDTIITFDESGTDTVGDQVELIKVAETVWLVRGTAGVPTGITLTQ